MAARKQAGAEAADGGRGQGSGGLDPNRGPSHEDLGEHPGLRGPTLGSPGSSAPYISRGSRDRPQCPLPLSCPFWCPAPVMSFTSRPQTSDHAEVHGSGQSPPAECRTVSNPNRLVFQAVPHIRPQRGQVRLLPPAPRQALETLRRRESETEGEGSTGPGVLSDLGAWKKIPCIYSNQVECPGTERLCTGHMHRLYSSVS